MKKLATLLLAAGMVVASTAPASAVDMKVDARYRVSFMTGETGFKGGNKEVAQQRLRLGLTMAASENLKGYVQFQMGKEAWGTATSNAGNTNDVSVRMAYIDWTVPATAIKVRMGRHQFGLPNEAFGNNSILGAGYGTRDGIVVTAPVADWLGLTAIWARLGAVESFEKAGNLTDLDQNKNDDIFALAANLKFDGISGAVYAAYGAIDGTGAETTGNGSSSPMGQGIPMEEGSAYWVGATATLSYFDPFTLKLSAAWGEFNAADDSSDDFDGWNVQAKASYKTAYGTPVLGAWYFSGYDEEGLGVMPNAGYFTATRSYHDAAKGLQGLYGGNGEVAGSWGVQAGIEKVSFVKGLSHDFLVTYMKGTNDKDCGRLDYWNLSEDDALVHIDFVNTYQIYKNLAAHLEFGYVIADFDDAADADNKALTEDDWRAELTFEFKF